MRCRNLLAVYFFVFDSFAEKSENVRQADFDVLMERR